MQIMPRMVTMTLGAGPMALMNRPSLLCLAPGARFDGSA